MYAIRRSAKNPESRRGTLHVCVYNACHSINMIMHGKIVIFDLVYSTHLSFSCMRSWDTNMQRVKDIVRGLSEEDPDKGPLRRRSKSTISTCSSKEHGGDGATAAGSGLSGGTGGESETTKPTDENSSDGNPTAEEVQEVVDMILSLGILIRNELKNAI